MYTITTTIFFHYFFLFIKKYWTNKKNTIYYKVVDITHPNKDEEEMNKDATNCEKGLYGESYVFDLLNKNDIHANWVALGNRHTKADFVLPDGRYVDIKYATPHLNASFSKTWRFNLHHHGTKQNGIDFYICMLDKGIDAPLIFIFPGEMIQGFQIVISENQLKRGRYDYFLENWDLMRGKD